MAQRHITLAHAYRLTNAYTPESLGMKHAGKPVWELAGGTNNFYQVIYTDNSSIIVFSPDSQRPITIRHRRPPRHHRRARRKNITPS